MWVALQYTLPLNMVYIVQGVGGALKGRVPFTPSSSRNFSSSNCCLCWSHRARSTSLWCCCVWQRWQTTCDRGDKQHVTEVINNTRQRWQTTCDRGDNTWQRWQTTRDRGDKQHVTEGTNNTRQRGQTTRDRGDKQHVTEVTDNKWQRWQTTEDHHPSYQF